MSSRTLIASGLSALLWMGCQKSPENPPPPSSPETPPVAPPPAPLAADGLPSAETERAIVLGQCQICHSAEYVQQQRLTPAQWAATVKKMIGWGAPISEEQGAKLAQVLAEAYPADRPDDPRPLVAGPGAGR